MPGCYTPFEARPEQVDPLCHGRAFIFSPAASRRSSFFIPAFVREDSHLLSDCRPPRINGRQSTHDRQRSRLLTGADQMQPISSTVDRCRAHPTGGAEPLRPALQARESPQSHTPSSPPFPRTRILRRRDPGSQHLGRNQPRLDILAPLRWSGNIYAKWSFSENRQ